MLNVFKTLIMGSSARAEGKLTDHFAIDLLEQKIRESEQGLEGAKGVLASLIVRARGEEAAMARVVAQLADLEGRAREALAAGNEAMALEAARAIASIENEKAVRQAALDRLNLQVSRTRASIEKTHRRVVDLHHGMVGARAVEDARKAREALSGKMGTSSIREAEALVARVLNRPDDTEREDVLDELDAGLDHTAVRDRLAAAGYGTPTRVTAADVMARLAS